MIRIMAIGDSLTAGNGEPPGGYRLALQCLLKEFGIEHRFVGSQGPNPGMPDGWHEGYPGCGITDLHHGIVTEWFTIRPITETLRAHDPDVLLLLAGTNPIYLGDPREVGAQMESLLDAIGAAAPSVHVMVGSILPIMPGPKPWNMTVPDTIVFRVKAYNLHVAGLVAARRRAGRAVSFVDHYPLVKGAEDLAPDGVHPLPHVKARMGWVWFAGLKAAGVGENA